jgi:hypothetical protein
MSDDKDLSNVLMDIIDTRTSDIRTKMETELEGLKEARAKYEALAARQENYAPELVDPWIDACERELAQLSVTHHIEAPAKDALNPRAAARHLLNERSRALAQNRKVKR